MRGVLKLVEVFLTQLVIFNPAENSGTRNHEYGPEVPAAQAGQLRPIS